MGPALSQGLRALGWGKNLGELARVCAGGGGGAVPGRDVPAEADAWAPRNRNKEKQSAVLPAVP